ncbi:hypothetical protein NKG05_22000 [Oerskovia sp. M15]
MSPRTPAAPRPARPRWRRRPGAVLLAGCASELPTPAADATSTTPVPALTVEQMAEVREAVGTTLEEANANSDPSQLATRLAGPALALRTSQLTVAAARQNGDLVTVLPTDVQQDVITTTDSWPRQAYAVTVQPEDLQSPRLLGYEQGTARDLYKLWAWVRLFPSVELPSFAGAAVGSESVPLDDPSLLVTPADAVAQYADVLTLGRVRASPRRSPTTRCVRGSRPTPRPRRLRSPRPPAPDHDLHADGGRGPCGANG